MSDKATISRDIKALLESQLLAVLSTQREGQPYASLVAFAASEDITEIYFATARSTTKFTNIKKDKRVALLIDNRSNRSEDFHGASAVTVIGTADDLKNPEREIIMKKYLVRHPSLEDFIKEPTTALLKVDVSRYILVTRFQEVFELHPGE